MSRNGLVGVFSCDSNATTVSLFEVPGFIQIAKSQIEITTLNPRNGWYEYDPMQIIQSINKACENVLTVIKNTKYTLKNVISVSICNQRETTIAWDSITSRPLYNAIAGCDIRTVETVEMIRNKIENLNIFRELTGLPLSTYFSALKIRWLLDNEPLVQQAKEHGRLKVGTVDSWVVWMLTNSALHVTDVTNASHTLLMNLKTEDWDRELLNIFDIDLLILPTIQSCSEIYGYINQERCPFIGVKISGIIGNQQAILLGHFCVKPTQIKATYHSSTFIMCNTGEQIVQSTHGLLTTIAYKLGPSAKTIYALEGANAVANRVFIWLTKKMKLFPKLDQMEPLAASVPTSGGVYFVPGFAGLYAPYWVTTSRGIIIGLTQCTTKHHIVRAALESICFSTCDIVKAIMKDYKIELNRISVDGDARKWKLLLRLQADIAGVNVMAIEPENAAELGAAYAAALAPGLNIITFNPDRCFYGNIRSEIYEPRIDKTERDQRYATWTRAVMRTFGWARKLEK